MLRVSEKHRLQRILFSKVTLAVLLVLTVIFAKGAWNAYQKSAYAKENKERAEEKLGELNTRRENLENELARLETERGIEEEIRQKFDVGREGEHLVVLVDSPDAGIVPTPAPDSLWGKLKAFFGFE